MHVENNVFSEKHLALRIEQVKTARNRVSKITFQHSQRVSGRGFS